MGLARVGTRAALSFSFAFLRRAWKSGEDTEMCSELLMEALDALQTLPEASLFDTSQISILWMEVVEKSIKFLRQVVLGDIMGGRCVVPKIDRHIALSLLLELGAQKGTLSGSLEGVLLLLTLWEKDLESEDNRRLPQSCGAPIVAVLRKYEKIHSFMPMNISEAHPSGPTESFLRFLTLSENDNAFVDLRQSAVIIISHLDRLARSHLPIGSYPTKTSSGSLQKIFTLGWNSLCYESIGFINDSHSDLSFFFGNTPNYSSSTIDLESSLKIQQCVCADHAILMLTEQNTVYIKYYENSDVSEKNTPIHRYEAFEEAIVKLAAHCEGKHFLALTNTNEVYSWGLGEGGRLGHGDNTSQDYPQKIQTLSDKTVWGIFCGATYSAALTVTGELYTWGRGTYGRLGHGNSDDKLNPTLVQALRSHKIVDVALGSGESHSLCCTDAGLVFAWGDGDFGKLGNGSLNVAQLPIQIDILSGIMRVYSGSEFSVALGYDGNVYSWGNGLGGRLGHGNNDQCNIPKKIQALDGKKIINIAVGSAHCLALSNTGELFGWGRNDYQQICPPFITRETIIKSPIPTTPPTLKITGMVCGKAQSIVWCNTSTMGISSKLPFVVDLSEHTFRLLDQLLCMVSGSGSGIGNTQNIPNDARHPPSQETECIVVACLNLLRLQFHAIISNNVSTRLIGLNEGSRLLASLKNRILYLAGGSFILKTMQEAAQWTLQVGWSILLPTASERAQTLTSLLPSSHESGVTSSGHRFMTDLLVGSLMAEGGLQTALNQAINSQPQDCENSHHLPLLHLLNQLLK